MGIKVDNNANFVNFVWFWKTRLNIMKICVMKIVSMQKSVWWKFFRYLFHCQNLSISYVDKLNFEWNLGIMYWNLNAHKTLETKRPVFGIPLVTDMKWIPKNQIHTIVLIHVFNTNFPGRMAITISQWTKHYEISLINFKTSSAVIFTCLYGVSNSRPAHTY